MRRIGSIVRKGAEEVDVGEGDVLSDSRKQDMVSSSMGIDMH